MLLHTPLYLIFLSAVILICWLLPGQSWRKVFLLFASYFFYILFDWRFALLLLILTLIAFLLGKAIERGKNPRLYFWISVIINIFALVFFKLSGFFINSLESMLQMAGLNVFSPGLTLLLPVGISFYTFQAISYTTDIYRRKIKPTGSLVDFGLYLAFFPKLIAGPLVRPQIFFEQVSHPKASLSKEEYLSALGLLLLGLVKKVIIADSLAGRADVAFRAAGLPLDGAQFASPIFIQGFYLYAFQIYADFSGYTDIARSSAALLGFSLPENFQQPYLASTITSFWNRWHMSLTQWFREFLYFPFSRAFLSFTHRRHPRIVQNSANLLTMILIGLWHGMAWTFVAWGFWHGVLLSLESWIGWKQSRRISALLSGMITFHLVGLGWVLFRSQSFAAAGRFLQGLFSFNQMIWMLDLLPSILITAFFVFGIDLAASGRLSIRYQWMRYGFHAIIIAAVFVLVILQLLAFARGTDSRPFIYGQF